MRENHQFYQTNLRIQVLIAKPRFLLLRFQDLRFYIFINNFMILHKINSFLNKIEPIWALMGP